MKRITLLLLWCCSCHAATSVIQGNTHADTFIAPAVNAVLGAGHVDVDIFVDTTGDGPPSQSANSMSASMLSTARTNFQVATGNPVNHAPYPVSGLSQCKWTPAGEAQIYSSFIANAQSMAWAYGAQPLGSGGCGPNPAGTAPPVLVFVASSANSGNGGTAPGIEFGFSNSYLGLNTTADSWITAALAGFVISMSYQHPTWNSFDIKGAFRQTAGNWSTGYDDTQFGYGTLNYTSATAVASPAAVFLQPPGVSVVNNGYYAIISLYPFRQTRRQHEEIYSVPSGYVGPLKNEYTSADIAAIGGTLLYTSNGSDIVPAYTYAPAASGTLTFIAFTTDGSGGYSRYESFSKNTFTLTVGTSCNR